MTNERRAMFIERYGAQNIPWDTGITPPEIIQIVQTLSSGCALDLGCGTGTNLRFLLEQGWQVDGVDFVSQAVAQAQTKLADFPAETWSVYCHDVTQLKEINSLRSPYDLVIDIGCGHGLSLDEAAQYGADIAALMRPGATWMLYAHQATENSSFGWRPEDVHRIFAQHFKLRWRKLSNDTTTGRPSGWYHLIAH